MAVWLPRFKLDCRTCSATQKKHRGCESEALQPFILDIDKKKEELKCCPIKLITETTFRIMRYHQFYEDGFLPSSGGIDNQSALLLDSFLIIENEIGKMREEDAKRTHAK